MLAHEPLLNPVLVLTLVARLKRLHRDTKGCILQLLASWSSSAGGTHRCCVMQIGSSGGEEKVIFASY